VVARNNFGPPVHTLDQIRDALTLDDAVPLIDCDARDRDSGKAVLITLVDHLYALSRAQEMAS
jgi:hypothetical protein